jgi:hypothetical protein
MRGRTILAAGAGLVLAALVLAVPTTARAQEGCTLTQGYWKTHPGSWPVTGLLLGGVAYNKEQLIEILTTPTRGAAPYILAHQLIAAKLNVLSGADSTSIAPTITAADSWLVSVGGLGEWPTGALREEGLALAAQLDAFNNGHSGVPHCDDGVVPPPPPPSD